MIGPHVLMGPSINGCVMQRSSKCSFWKEREKNTKITLLNFWKKRKTSSELAAFTLFGIPQKVVDLQVKYDKD